MCGVDAKQVIGRYWAEQAPSFDSQSLHAIETDAERQAWNRILNLLTDGRTLDVLDVGCGTGIITELLATRGHRVTGSDLAPAMIERAQQKAQQQGLAVTYLVDDAEALSLADASFDLVVSRHLFWTLPHPERALAEWVRVTRPGGRVAVIDGQWSQPLPDGTPNAAGSATRSGYGDAVLAALPHYGGAPPEQVAEMMMLAGIATIRIDTLDDLVAAQRARMSEADRARRHYSRYAVFGDRPGNP